MSHAPGISPLRVAQLLGARDDRGPAYRWLADGLRLLIADGRIPTGHALPSERVLTTHLGLSRTTVTRAYATLREAGYLVSRQGSGHVSTLPLGGDGGGMSGALLPGSANPEGVLDLTCAACRAPAGMAEAYEAALAALPRYLASTGYATAGLPELREAIAARYRERGVPTTADQIMVTSGALAGVSLAARALVRPGQQVLMETPTYPNAIAALRRAGARLRALPVEPTGWDAASAAATIVGVGATAAVLIPDFHNPTGSLMEDADRARIAAALKRADTLAIIDETILEVRLEPEGPVPSPFAAHLTRSISVGSSSKSHWGGLRTGWLRAPVGLMPRLLQARIAGDLGAPILEQLVLLDLLRRDPGLHPERRADLLASRKVMLEALPSALPGARWQVPRGGLSLWVELPGRLANQLAVAAEGEGLLLTPGPQFAVSHGHDRFVRLPYKDPPDIVAEAMRRLGRAAQRIGSLPAAPVIRPNRRPVVA